MNRFPANHFSAAALTDMGRIRKNNEDAVLAMPQLGCFVISDGMGGGKAGEIASAMMVNETEKTFSALSGSSTPGEREGAFIRTAYRVNFAVRDYADSHQYASMGATVVALVLNPWQPDSATVFHAGDSRAYRIRDDRIEQLMEDHSVAASQQIDENKLSPMLRGALTNALGTGNDFFLEKTAIDLREGDLFILCSDGLTRMVRDSEILQYCSAKRYEPEINLATALIQAALKHGGKDNVSVIVLRIRKLWPPYEPSETESAREANSRMRNLMDLTDTQPTEMAIDLAPFSKQSDSPGEGRN